MERLQALADAAEAVAWMMPPAEALKVTLEIERKKHAGTEKELALLTAARPKAHEWLCQGVPAENSGFAD